MNIDEYRKIAAQESKEEQPDEVVDTQVEVKEDVVVEKDVEKDVEPNNQKEESVKEESTTVEQPNTINIEGIGEVKIEEIKDWHKGNLRLSDYTRKTQEVARQRKEAEDALELYSYLKANPELANKLKESDEATAEDKAKLTKVDPIYAEIEALKSKNIQMELDREIQTLSQKYPDFDEVKVLSEAYTRKIDDLEFVYKALREESKKDEPIDVEKIKAEAIAEAKKQLMAEIEKDKEDTTVSVITSNQDTPPDVGSNVELTASQKRVAKMMGLSEEEYMKWL